MDKPLRPEYVVLESDGETTTITNMLSGSLLVANTVGSRILELCDGTNEISSIVRTIMSEFTSSISAEEVTSHVASFVEVARGKGILN